MLIDQYLNNNLLKNAIINMSSSTSQQFEYRQDLNGLRGIAIVLVALFHGLRSYSVNGRVGVDIFFVLSGYLISSIIFKERSKGSFTLKNFYARRIKRLAPALIFFLAFLLHNVQVKFGRNKQRVRTETQQIIASVLMSENIYHIKMINDKKVYWYGVSHLWSLGIQQQFYIFWPLMTSFIYKLNLRLGILVILIFAGLSLWSQLYIEGAYKFANYCKFLPFTRFWEFLAGSLLAFIQFKVKFQNKESDQKANSIQVNTVEDQSQSSDRIQNSSEVIQTDLKIQSQEKVSHVIQQQISSQSSPILALKDGKVVFQMSNVEKLFNLKYFLLLLRQMLPLGGMYLIYSSATTDMNFISGLQHVGFGYFPVVIGTVVLIFSKDTLFNKYILSTKFLLLWGDISYPFYLWHFGLAMHDYGANIYQIYSYAMIFSILSLLYVEPMFRKSTNKWTIPFLILAQILIIVKALKLYYQSF